MGNEDIPIKVTFISQFCTTLLHQRELHRTGLPCNLSELPYRTQRGRATVKQLQFCNTLVYYLETAQSLQNMF